MRWRTAPSCRLVLDEANDRWPNRSRISDGTVGDAAHASRKSHHNPHPDGGWVDAVDLTHDPANGCDAHAWARQVAERKDPRVEYLISNGLICRGYPRGKLPAWLWTRYTGSNPHTKHVHVSIWRNDKARNDLRPWFTEEDDMFTDDDRQRLADVHALLTNPKDPSPLHEAITGSRDNTNRLRRMLRLVAAKVGVRPDEIEAAESLD